MVKNLTLAFKTSFEDIRKHNPDCQLFAHPFDLVEERYSI